MNETKVYTLPDLPPAPTSDLQLLVRRLIEYADLSTLPAVEDELKERKWDKGLERFRFIFSDYTMRVLTDTNDHWTTVRWKRIADSLTELFFFDLFSWGGVVGTLSGRIRSEKEVFDPQTAMPMDSEEQRTYQATEAIPAGAMCLLQYNPATVRLATAEEVGGE